MKLPGGLTRPSLARRLALLAVGWSFAALVIAAVVLALLFQQAALRRFDASLSDLIDNLISGSTIEAGEVVAPALTDQRALLDSVPRVDGPTVDRLPAIAGTPLTGLRRPPGCAFAPRCELVQAACVATPPPLRPRHAGSDHLDACVLAEVAA